MLVQYNLKIKNKYDGVSDHRILQLCDIPTP